MGVLRHIPLHAPWCSSPISSLAAELLNGSGLGLRSFSAAAAAAASTSAARRKGGAASSGNAAAASASAAHTAALSGKGAPPPAPAPAPHQRWSPDADDARLPTSFSLRPSALSPLHAVYRDNQRRLQRADFARLCLLAQTKLEREIDPPSSSSDGGSSGGGGDPVRAALASRRAKIAALASEYAAAACAAPAPLPPARDASLGKGYVAVLEKQLAERLGDSIELARVFNGERDVFEYWLHDFAPRYDGLPGLARLDGALLRPSGAAHEELLRRRAVRALARGAAPQPHPRRVDAAGRARATGRRKTAVAQVTVRAGTGRVTVNGSPLDDYFRDTRQRAALLRPLMAANALGVLDVDVRVAGSGLSGQAQAAAHGAARAMQDYDPSAYRGVLRAGGFLKRDPRMVERKKAGRPKARKAFTWVKR